MINQNLSFKKLLSKNTKRIQHIGIKEAKEKKPNITASLCGRLINVLQKYNSKDEFIQDSKDEFITNFLTMTKTEVSKEKSP